MEQEMLEVVKDGKVWFEFPSANEMNVRAMLMKDNLDRVCEIRRKNININVVKEKVTKQEKVIDLNKQKETKEKP
jgi:predicted transcriptional regulator